MNKEEMEMLLNLKEQGFMEDIDCFYKNIPKEEGIVRTILLSGYYQYYSMMIGTFYLPLAKFIILSGAKK